MSVKTLFVVWSCRRCEEAVGPSEFSGEIVAGVQVSAETFTETHKHSQSRHLNRVRPLRRVRPVGSIGDADALDFDRMKQEILEEVVRELHKVKDEIIDGTLCSGLSVLYCGMRSHDVLMLRLVFQPLDMNSVESAPHNVHVSESQTRAEAAVATRDAAGRCSRIKAHRLRL
ncbi:Ena/VASP-like protein [Anabarilius grahami]|uniref:Ena/VASP-like protein n=1 Tax=Anabarilius grahami TaxID=495550 RepID=A0A3N0YEB6_ANAGA|nr:Ena/VASP-like protein [Anabarilius grahami]